MVRLVLGNIFGLACEVLCALSSFCKTRKNIAGMQAADSLCGVISNLILGGYSGAVTQLMSVIRNTMLYFGDIHSITQIVLVILTLIAGLTTNNRGMVGTLPVLSSVLYAVVIMRVKDVDIIRLALVLNNVCWTIYNFIIMDYAGCIFGLCIIASGTFNLVKSLRERAKVMNGSEGTNKNSKNTVEGGV